MSLTAAGTRNAAGTRKQRLLEKRENLQTTGLEDYPAINVKTWESRERLWSLWYE